MSRRWKKWSGVIALVAYATASLASHALHDLACEHQHKFHDFHVGADCDDEVAHGEAAHDSAGESLLTIVERQLSRDSQPAWQGLGHSSVHDEANCAICQYHSQSQLSGGLLCVNAAPQACFLKSALPVPQPRTSVVRAFDSRGPPLSAKIS